MALFLHDLGHRCLIGENHEGEPTRSIGLSVVDDFDGLDFSIILKVSLEEIFVGVTRATDEQLSVLFITHGVNQIFTMSKLRMNSLECPVVQLVLILKVIF